jgi:hypothetical protein
MTNQRYFLQYPLWHKVKWMAQDIGVRRVAWSKSTMWSTALIENPKEQH